MIPIPNVDVQFHQLAGGLDLVTAATLIKPGYVMDSCNYEIDSINGGYRRINGFERFDGRTSPSTATYSVIDITLTGTLAVGNTITGNTSAATGKILQINAGELIIGRVTGTFVSGENLMVSAVKQAESTSAAIVAGASSVATHMAYKSLAADDLRADIQAVPGSGQIRGLVYYKSVLYAFRNNAGGTAVDIYKHTGSGWANVPLLYEVQFTGGGGATPTEGATLTQGGVTATFRRAAKQSGAWTGAAAGRLLISAPSGGNFAAGAATIGATTLTLSGAQTAVTLPAGGNYEFVQYNFTGSTDTQRVYGVNGSGLAFEFDGTYLVPIRTGMTTDTPSHIAAHRNYLFLSFRGSLQMSGIGDPYAWSPVLGASEIAMGDTITALLPFPGDATTSAMSVFSSESTRTLYGSSSADFKLATASPTTGAKSGTAQWLGAAYCLSDRGVQQVSQSLAFGDFQFNAVSGLIQPLINDIQGTVTTSCVLKEKNQYRLFFSDGIALCMGIGQGKYGPISTGFMKLDYGIPVRCVATGMNSFGREVCYFGSDDGYVYQDSVGTSFDGSAIESWLRLPYNHLKTPRYLKTFRKAVLDIVVDEYATLSTSYDLAGGSPVYAQSSADSKATVGAGGYWDQFTWDDFTWDAPIVTSFDVPLGGTEKNISLLVYGNSAIDSPHTIQGATFQFTIRRLAR